jgi:murein DD-endopeptidase MepM/ murein hydrolase activator NlpD
MRTWLAICALALAGCAAETKAEAQIPCAEPLIQVTNSKIKKQRVEQIEKRENLFSQEFSRLISNLKNSPNKATLKQAKSILPYTECDDFPESQKANRKALINLIAMTEAKTERDIDSLLDQIEIARANLKNDSAENAVRNFRAYSADFQVLEDADLSESQQARYDALRPRVQANSVDEILDDIRKNAENFEIDPRLAGLSVPEYRRLLQEKDNLDMSIAPLAQNDPQRAILIAERDAVLAEIYRDRGASKLSCHGIVKQGGLVVCQTTPNARVEVGRSENDTYTQTADKNGVLLVGFDRDEPAAFVRVGEQRVDFDINPREYDISRIDGLPKRFVSEYTPEQLAQIRKATKLKKVGFASKVEEIGFKNGFIYPVTTHTKTTNFGAQRILNGDPKRPHFGVDLAAPKGTPILAPADGIVSLASEEMYFEGSLIMIDHGQGLISYYLHNETVDVQEGQRVVQGQQIGTVGSRGRSTGPHLCWRLKWRGRNLDPELLTAWPAKDTQ